MNIKIEIPHMGTDKDLNRLRIARRLLDCGNFLPIPERNQKPRERMLEAIKWLEERGALVKYGEPYSDNHCQWQCLLLTGKIFDISRQWGWDLEIKYTDCDYFRHDLSHWIAEADKVIEYHRQKESTKER